MNNSFSLDYIMSHAWALDQRYLEMMTSLAARNTKNIDLSKLNFTLNTANEAVIEALEGKAGKSVARGLEIRGNTAVIHVHGVISRYASLFDNICGGTSTQVLAKHFTSAVENKSIKNILLYVDSPGGHAAGIHEFSEMIYSARDKKKVIAYVGDCSCSAAYWATSAASEVVIDATARLGSIGTVVTARRMKENADDEIETIEIVSSQSPKKRLSPFSEEGREAYQMEMDQLADIFIDRVARNVGTTRENVLKNFGEGGTLIGQKAVDAGMAHRLGSFEGVISELNKGKQRMTEKTNPQASGDITLPKVEASSTDTLISAITEQRPDVIAAIKAGTDDNDIMAIDCAAELAQTCATSGIAGITANLLKPSITKAQADSQIKAAMDLKSTLAASGIEDSFEALVSHIDDPVALAGKVAHEIGASHDESGNVNRQVGTSETPKASIKAKDVYANR